MLPIRLSRLDSRLFMWSNSDLYDRVCPFCEASGFEKFLRPDNLIIRFCDICGGYFVSPAPSSRTISEFYKKYSRFYCPNGTLDENQANAIKSADPLLDNRIREFASVMDLKGKMVLDVGCGNGAIMYKLGQMGAIVEGVDLDLDNVRATKAFLDLDVSCKKIDELKGKKYNLIVMNDLIEHVLEPMTLLKRAHQLLAKKGYISIFTPNASVAHLKNDPVLFRVDLEHINYLTSKTCKYIASKLAMQEITIQSLGFPSLRRITKQKSDPLRLCKGALRSLIKISPLKSYYTKRRRSKSLVKQDISLACEGDYSLFFLFQKH